MATKKKKATKTNIKLARRPLAARKATHADDVKKVLSYIEARLTAEFGEDEAPSEVWAAFCNFQGIDSLDAELAQDIGIAARDLVRLARTSIKPDGKLDELAMGVGLLALAGELVPEIKADVEAIRAKLQG